MREKWAASYDTDEYMWPESAMKVRGRPAGEVLDQADESMGSAGHMVMQWLNFKMRCAEDMQRLSTGLLRGESARLRHMSNESLSERCYNGGGDGSGKAVVRCDVGLGFTVHHPVVVDPGARMMRFLQGKRRYKGLRTWHARVAKARSMCYFQAS